MYLNKSQTKKIIDYFFHSHFSQSKRVLNCFCSYKHSLTPEEKGFKAVYVNFQHRAIE